MCKFLYPVLFLVCSFHHLSAQVFPPEGRTLNYTLIGFSFTPVPQATHYTIQVAAGNHNSQDTFNQNIILTIPLDTNKIIVRVPSFGQQYTWRVIPSVNDEGAATHYTLHHFSTGMIPAVDTALNRLRITVPARQYKDAAVFIDALGVLYDMDGRPIWYLPSNNDNAPGDIRDLRISPFGTITFLRDSRAYEVNYNGDILWQKPGAAIPPKDIANNDNLFHHEFTRLANGHYMALGTEKVICKLPTLKDSSFLIIPDEKFKTDTNKIYRKIPFGTLTEFDQKGNIVWQWKTLKYIMSSDLKYIGLSTNWIDLHDNSFFFDEQNKFIYISFRDINRVIKIKYPDGNIVNVYGNKYDHGAEQNANPIFHAQHACKRSANGYLYLFDNESDPGASSKILIIKEPLTDQDTIKKKWEYECSIDPKDKYTLKGQNAGGNVIELPGGSIFASMGKQFSKVFIVSPAKQILWSAMSETWKETEKKWQMTSSYRASVIPSRAALDQLIWNSEK